MKKTLILLSLIYFVSCEISCMGTDNLPENYEDCYNRGLENENEDVCCYLKVKTPAILLSTCVELPNSLNKDFAKKVLISQYKEQNFTLEDFSCPTKKKEDDTSNNLCDFKTGPKESKDCFGLTLTDESNYCCYMKVSIDGISQSVCREITKELSANDIKQRIIEEISAMNAQLDEFQCPS